MYNQTVMTKFLRPENAGALRGANAVGKAGNSTCGDVIKLYLFVDEDGVVEEAKFKTFGCPAAIACSDVACDLVRGLKIDEALDVSSKEIFDELGGLEDSRVYCSVLAEDAIKLAVENYYKKKGKED